MQKLCSPYLPGSEDIASMITSSLVLHAHNHLWMLDSPALGLCQSGFALSGYGNFRFCSHSAILPGFDQLLTLTSSSPLGLA